MNEMNKADININDIYKGIGDTLGTQVYYCTPVTAESSYVYESEHEYVSEEEVVKQVIRYEFMLSK